ncbi:MAG: ABC-type transport system involved in resistance to organic solvent, periplasmic component [Deltaproteobacteria bacterium]|jgi:phospholipid/cholesterol/gamma-HCH transport system substrate-binding protein|nr:ABC-type transport system involved in resistance to organic solvent, periplasmic component [Deltaproteobacteria bacterium]
MKKYAMETIVGIFVVIGLICVGYITVKLGKVSILEPNTYRLNARFASASGLRVGSAVEIYGIQVGKVDRLRIDSQRQMALIALRIDNGIKVYDDAMATIKTSGLIGDKYVKIDPGGAGAPLNPGGTITETSAPLDIEELIGKYAFGDVKKEPTKPQGK